MLSRFSVGGLVVATAAATLVATTMPASAKSAHPSPAQVPAKWASLAASSTPKTITLDTATGKVLNVTTGLQIRPSAITLHNPCQTGDACWEANAVPYANYGFAGTGAKTGNWPQRYALFTNAHSTSICWAESPNCSATYGPNSAIGFAAYPVTGTRVTNQS